MLTYEQNVKAVLECIFAGYKDELIEDACKRICALKCSEKQGLCEDCISRQAALDAFGLSEKSRKYGGDHSGYDTIMLYEVQDALEALPPVTPQTKTGRWSRKTKVDAYDIAGVKTWGIKCQCDRCDFTIIVVEDFGYYKYCPNCGAKMTESEK